MQILADENIPFKAVVALREADHDVKWIREENPGIKDEAVIEIARIEKRILITFDKDFGDLVFRRRIVLNTGVVLFRLSLMTPEQLAASIVTALDSQPVWEGYLSVVEDNRIRMTPLP